MRTILTEVPRLVGRFLATGSLSLIAMALELAVPPLSLLVGITLVSAIVFAGVGLATTNWWPLACLAAAIAFAAAGMGLVWLRSGREILPGKMIVAEIPRYIGAKAPMYLRFLSRPQTDWVRTERSKPLAASAEGISTPHSRNFAAADNAKNSSSDA